MLHLCCASAILFDLLFLGSCAGSGVACIHRFRSSEVVSFSFDLLGLALQICGQQLFSQSIRRALICDHLLVLLLQRKRFVKFLRV